MTSRTSQSDVGHGPDLPFSERDIVRLRFDTARGDTLFQAGSLGTIVHCYANDAAFEVEFTDPMAGVLTLEPLDILPLSNDP